MTTPSKQIDVCDNCKREPELMHTDGGRECWFFIIQKGQDEPIALVFGKKEMPEFTFQVCLERHPVLTDGEKAICGKCLDAIYPDNATEDL